MNKWIAAVTAVLVASPLAMVGLNALGLGAGFHVDAPEWQSGYTWTYDVTGKGRASGQILGIMSAETKTGHMEATRRAEVMNTTLEENGVPLYAVLEGFRVDRVLYGDKVVYNSADPDAHAPEPGEFEDEYFCLTPCGTFLAGYTQADTNPYLGALGELDQAHLFDFPLTRNKEWSIVNTTIEGGLVEIRARAVEKEWINPPGMRPVEAIRIEAGITEASKRALRDLARDAAANEQITLDTDFDLTFTYWYAPDVGNIVQLDTVGWVAARASGFGAAGNGRLDFSATQLLTDYSLAVKPERTMAEAAAMAFAAWEDGGDTSDLAPQPWRFSAAASALSVDATGSPTITLGTVDGWAPEDAATTTFENPREARIEWSHRYYDGQQQMTERLSGDQYELVIADPGRHVFTARAYDSQDRLLGADDLVIEAYTRTTCTLDSPAGVGLGGLTSYTSLCEAAVAPGMTQAVLSKHSELIARGEATLWVDGEAIMTSDLEEPLVVSALDQPGTWLVGWQDTARVGPVTFELEVRYDRNGEMPTMTPESNGPDAFGHALLERLAGLL